MLPKRSLHAKDEFRKVRGERNQGRRAGRGKQQGSEGELEVGLMQMPRLTLSSVA